MARRSTPAIPISRTTSTGTNGLRTSCRWGREVGGFWISAAFTCSTTPTHNRSTSADARAGAKVPVQFAGQTRQWCIVWPDGHAILPVRRTDGDVTRIAAGAALELGITDRH